VAEAVGSGAVVVAQYLSDWAFSRQVFATLASERAAEEAKSVSNAFQQLLSVTCDACLRFVVQHPSCLAALT